MRTEHFKTRNPGEEKRITIDTQTDHAGCVFLHIGCGGFHFCELMTADQARAIAYAFLDAAHAAEDSQAQEVTQA